MNPNLILKKSMLALVSMLFLFNIDSATAQSFEIKRSHAISSLVQPEPLPAIGELDVVAIMVEFQPDTNRLTSGTGIFGPDGMDGLPYLTRESETFIDPLPHDTSYFKAKLEFARNYFFKSSDGQLSISYRVLPTIYQLDKKMEEYSPIGETFSTEKLADFLNDVWTEVEEQGGFNTAGLDPETTAFVVFHAGVGRDVELTGTTLDITPFDIPSINMREQELEKWLGNDFDGFPINNGSFLVKNSIIMPRTESRRGEDIQENEIVFPLSTNGLLSASIGSHLGLPDLFNTETGEPAIGRFGLMDGAGFFSYNGLIPPEPSAWEKIFLGWETPFTITTSNTDSIPLPAASLALPNSIAKYDLSSTEYFLVENRHRDIDGTGVTITTQRPDGSITQKTFTNLDEAFVFQESGFDSLLDAGTIINVSNFDWSLPGGIDIGNDEQEGTDDDRQLNGGMLIWHIDEAIIDQQLSSSSVNADPLLRGVDLEEGDGAQDIGRESILLDNSPNFGFAFDFWWAGNNYRVITQTGSIDLNPDNIFGPETFPDNSSNSGALSGFEFYDFSENVPMASFRIRAVETTGLGFQNLFEYQTGTNIFYTNEDPYWDYFPLQLDIVETNADTLVVAPAFSNYHVYDYEKPEDRAEILLLGTRNQQSLVIGARVTKAENPISSPESSVNSADLNTATSWSVSATKETAFLSSQDGISIDLDFTTTRLSAADGSVLPVSDSFEFRSEIINGSFVGISDNVINFEGENLSDYITSATDRLFAGTISSNLGNFYYLFEDGAFKIVDPRADDAFVEIFEEEKAEWPAIIDEGYIYRINQIENTIEGYNFSGALLPDTPIPAPEGFQLIGTPLVADITGDNIQDLIVVGQTDFSVNIFAFEANGNPIEGFPLNVGGSIGKDVQPIHPMIYQNRLYAISHTGDLKAWEFENFTSTQWPRRYGPNPYNKVSAYITFSDSQTGSFSVLNKNETYNWPNPADQETNLRFEVKSPGGTVEVTVIDYSGRVVFERTVEARGGVPEEIPINTSNWGSGAYFARIKATVEGRSESKVVKIGVAH